MGSFDGKKLIQQLNERANKNLELIDFYNKNREFLNELINAFKCDIDDLISYLKEKEDKNKDMEEIEEQLEDEAEGEEEEENLTIKSRIKIYNEFKKYIEQDYKEDFELPLVYEVTQRINTFFSSIIIPKEKFYYSLSHDKKIGFNNDEEIKICVENIIGIINICHSKGLYKTTYKSSHEIEKSDDFINVIEFLRHLRNALAHGGDEGLHFEILPENGPEITHVVFYDFNKFNENQSKEEFCICLSIDQIDELNEYVQKFYNRVEEMCNKENSNKIDYEELLPEIKKMRWM